MQLTGQNIIGFDNTAQGMVAIQALNPATGESLPTLFYKTTVEELQLAVKKANAAFQLYRKKSSKEKAAFLERIATEIENLGDKLLQRYCAESGLPLGRATGERGRTTGQLRLFAQVLREGSWVDARIDSALPDRQPPRPDIRSMERPLGVVGVFGASNFPLAFSVAGGDTASALAGGCPVIFKAHPAHLGTSELVGKAIQKAALATEMPDGVFSLLFDDGHEIGQALVKHPAIKAIAFTGSFKGGKALYDLAQGRQEPITVYAEMGSTNPVFVLPNAMRNSGAAIAKNYVASVTLGVGQFCTNPGILVVERDSTFLETLAKETQQAIGGVMLTMGIQENFAKATEKAKSYAQVLGEGNSSEGFTAVSPIFYKTSEQDFLEHALLSEEIFGPASLVVETKDKEGLLNMARQLSGQLTATIHGTAEDLKEYAELLEILEQKVGRLLINGFPTGVEVCHAMVHGGPFPATSDARSTSVGTRAIKRFTRPVCFQDFPDFALPDELKTENPCQIWRLVDGEFSKK